MKTQSTAKKVGTGLVFGVCAVALSACTVPFLNDNAQADERLNEVQAVFVEVDNVVADSETLSKDILDSTLTTEVMDQKEKSAEDMQDRIDQIEENLNGKMAILDEVEMLNLSQDYRDGKFAQVKEAYKKRMELLDLADESVFRGKSLANAVVNYESGVSRFQNAIKLFEQVPEVRFEDPQTIITAKAIFEEISAEVKTMQTELNDAAASVNADVFSKVRDSAGDLGKVTQATDELVQIFAQLLVAAQAGDAAAYEQAVGLIPVQIEVIVTALQTFDANYPYDLVDDNGDLTKKGQDQVEVWKDQNFKTSLNDLEKLRNEVDQIDAKISSQN